MTVSDEEFVKLMKLVNTLTGCNERMQEIIDTLMRTINIFSDHLKIVNERLDKVEQTLLRKFP